MIFFVMVNSFTADDVLIMTMFSFILQVIVGGILGLLTPIGLLRPVTKN